MLLVVPWEGIKGRLDEPVDKLEGLELGRPGLELVTELLFRVVVGDDPGMVTGLDGGFSEDSVMEVTEVGMVGLDVEKP